MCGRGWVKHSKACRHSVCARGHQGSYCVMATRLSLCQTPLACLQRDLATALMCMCLCLLLGTRSTHGCVWVGVKRERLAHRALGKDLK